MVHWTEKQLKKSFKNKMEYPQEFIDKCLYAYPDDKEIKQLLEDKSYGLRMALKKKCPKEITTEELIEAAEKGTTEERVERGKRIKAAKELCDDFFELYDEQYLSRGHMISDNGLEYISSSIKLEYDIRHGRIEKEGTITSAQLSNLERNISYRLKQNESRRIHGADEAGQYRTK